MDELLATCRAHFLVMHGASRALGLMSRTAEAAGQAMALQGRLQHRHVEQSGWLQCCEGGHAPYNEAGETQLCMPHACMHLHGHMVFSADHELMLKPLSYSAY